MTEIDLGGLKSEGHPVYRPVETDIAELLEHVLDIHKLSRESLQPDNGLLAQRLLPWAELNAPFEGAWCVVKPGTASSAHSHHEYEIFIAISGSATLESDGRRADFNAGDIAYFKPGQSHQVINDTDSDFQMYGVWWDSELAERFAARHEGAHTQ